MVLAHTKRLKFFFSFFAYSFSFTFLLLVFTFFYFLFFTIYPLAGRCLIAVGNARSAENFLQTSMKILTHPDTILLLGFEDLYLKYIFMQGMDILKGIKTF